MLFPDIYIPKASFVAFLLPSRFSASAPMHKYFVFWLFTISPHTFPLISLPCTQYLLYHLLLPPRRPQTGIYIGLLALSPFHSISVSPISM